MNQSGRVANTGRQRQARENANADACEQFEIGFVLSSDWLMRGAHDFFNQSQSVLMQKQSNPLITFDTRLKKTICEANLFVVRVR